jgi:hypothetical protein
MKPTGPAGVFRNTQCRRLTFFVSLGQREQPMRNCQ